MEFTQDDGFSAELFEVSLKNSVIDLELNMDLIEHDIARLKNKRAVDWLQELPSFVSGRLSWIGGKPLIKTDDGSIELANIKAEGGTLINMSRYLNIEAEKTYVYVDYSDIYNGLALELLGAQSVGVDVEQFFDDLNITIVHLYDAQMLKQLGWLGDSLVDRLRKSYCGCSPYLCSNGKESYDYFYNKVKINKNFSNVINSSIDTMLKLIVEELIKKHGKHLMIANICDTGLTLVVDSSKKEERDLIVEFIRQKVIFRVFGRKFGFSPTVTIVEGL